MTDKMIENRINKILALEAQIKEIEAETEAVKAELKAELESRSVSELTIKEHTVRYKEVITNRLDGKSLKVSFPDIYASFCKPSASMRFTVA